MVKRPSRFSNIFRSYTSRSGQAPPTSTDPHHPHTHTDALESLEPRMMMSGGTRLHLSEGPLTTPTALAAVVVSPTSVQLRWTDSDAAMFNILRSDNGVNFTQIGRVTASTQRTYTDSTVRPNRTYQYEVQAAIETRTSAISGMVSITTPMAAPSELTAVARGIHSIELHWRDNDLSATGYNILRSTDGRAYSLLSTISGGTASSFTDSTALSGTAYIYEVQALAGSRASAASNPNYALTPLAAPSRPSASVAANAVTLTWSGDDAAAQSIIVLRSTNGTTFSAIATLARTATTYIDSQVTGGGSFTYRIQAVKPSFVSGTSEPLTISTALLAPTALAAVVAESHINLSWTDPNRAGMGYLVLRSTDGTTFTQIASLAPGAAKTYSDFTAIRGTGYAYRVQAKLGDLVSANSNTATMMVPALPPSGGDGDITITTRFTNELVITSRGASDSISVSKSGSSLIIIADGQTFTRDVPAAGLFIYNRAGVDTIRIDSSVTIQTTITSIGAGRTTITSGDANLNAWLDSTDTFTGSGTSHLVSSFTGGVSKALGAALANPSDSGTTIRLNDSLLGTGPVAADANQGGSGDCYFVSSLAAFATAKPSVISNSMVDMGDGTYVTQFMQSGAPVYVRVTNELPAGGFGGLKYAHPGANNAMWAPIMEKAFAYFRSSAHTYAAIASGWMAEVYTALGVHSSSFGLDGSESSIYNMLAADVSGGMAVTFGTRTTAPQLIRGHAYSLVGVSREPSGATRYYVRNPWGASGDSMENSTGYAVLTFAQLQANFALGLQAAA